MTSDPAAGFAAHVADARFADLPAATITATKADLLDSLACALGGSGADGITALLRLQRHWGGRAEARTLLTGDRLPAPAAALLHGAMGHALDFDDTFDRGLNIHPGVSVLAAVLATIELVGAVPGREVVLAAALGLDISCRIALAATVDRGWHRTAAIGIFGATAAAGRLLGLSARQLHHAFGIAYSQSAGNKQCIIDGALTKRLQAGQAASNAVFAALLAKDGFTGASDVFGGKFGFFALYQPGSHDLAPLTDGLGQTWHGDEISVKPYPCGRPQHAAIDAALALHAELGAAGIEEVTVAADPGLIAENFAGAPHKRRPTQIVEAQFALPFLLATALLRGRLGIDDVAAFTDPAALALTGRIRGEPAPGPLRITVRHRRGEASREAGIPLGAPANPLDETSRIAKFRDCAAHARRPLEDSVLSTIPEMMVTLDRMEDARAMLHLTA